MTVDPAVAAREAFGWIGSVGVRAGDEIGWLEGAERFDDLYAGTAGVLLGCAEAYGAGLDVTAVAAGAVARLTALDDGAATLPDEGLFTGWAGVAVALQAWSDVAGDPGAATAAEVVRAAIAGRTHPEPPDPQRCTDVISGAAGTLLALLEGDLADTAAAANVLADRLVDAAERATGGRQWRMTAEWDVLMPGFSHGTAGVAYALAAAATRLNRPELLAVAATGAEALLAIGTTPAGWAVPLTIPARPDRPTVNFGWCHGPAGAARLFVLLDTLDPQPRWARAVDACIRALRASGLPARRYPGFWDNVARCCGTAGVGQFVLDRYLATGDPQLLAWVDELAADVLSRAIRTPAGVTWSNTEHTRTPSELPPQPGFMQGAAGIAGWLARLAAAHRGDARPSSRGWI
jgi:lantibiotic modifying enzyme